MSIREGNDLAVAGEEIIEQPSRRVLLVVQEEVAEVEQGLGPADLPEVDQPAVAAIQVEDRRGVEVAMGQPRASDFPAALAGHQLPEPIQLRAENSAANGPGHGSGR